MGRRRVEVVREAVPLKRLLGCPGSEVGGWCRETGRTDTERNDVSGRGGERESCGFLKPKGVARPQRGWLCDAPRDGTLEAWLPSPATCSDRLTWPDDHVGWMGSSWLS